MAILKSNKNSNKEIRKPGFIIVSRKAMLEMEDVPNDETISAIKEIEKGKIKSYRSEKELMAYLKKKANLGD